MASAATRQGGLLRIPRIFYGWWIVVAGFFAVMVSTGFAVHGVSTLVLPLEREFGWSRSAITGAFSLARVESGVLGPLSGWLTDRIGPRKMMFGGALLTAGGYFLLAHVTTLPMLYATIQGWNQLVEMGGVLAGPLLAAVLYDQTHSYVVAFLVFAVTCFVGMLFILAAKPPRRAEGT